jgi:glutamate formiminotransferase
LFFAKKIGALVIFKITIYKMTNFKAKPLYTIFKTISFEAKSLYSYSIQVQHINETLPKLIQSMKEIFIVASIEFSIICTMNFDL